MKTYPFALKTFIIIVLIAVASVSVFAQEQTPEPAPATEAPVIEVVPTEVVPTEVVPVEVIPTEAAPVVVETVVTEVAPVIVTEAAPVVAAPAVLDVSGVRAYFVPNTAAPVAGSPFTLDLMVTNPAAVGINSLALQCTLDQVLFMVDPMLAMAVEPVDGQPVPTPEPGIFGVNAYVLPLTVDIQLPVSKTVTAAQTIGVPAFASGKVESFNLRAVSAGTFNMNCTATVVDANGLTGSW
ncbi:MAG: hypothetical protein U0694_13350 [Anaerolineae bacterium]